MAEDTETEDAWNSKSRTNNKVGPLYTTFWKSPNGYIYCDRHGDPSWRYPVMEPRGNIVVPNFFGDLAGLLNEVFEAGIEACKEEQRRFLQVEKK